MLRSILAVIAAAALTFGGVTLGQDERPHAEHAMPGEHSAAGHGMDGEHVHEEPALEEHLPQRQSFLVWLISALGWKYVLLLPASALLSFALTALLVMAGKGKTTGAALGFIVAIPFLIGIFGMLDGFMASFMVIASSSSAPKPSVIASGVSTSIVTPLVGLLLMVPSYLLATVGLSIRALQSDPKS